jgi:hypothetical protein
MQVLKGAEEQVVGNEGRCELLQGKRADDWVATRFHDQRAIVADERPRVCVGTERHEVREGRQHVQESLANKQAFAY